MLASLVKSKHKSTVDYRAFSYRMYLLQLLNAIRDHLKAEAFQPLAEALRDTVLPFMESELSDDVLKNISTGDVRTFTFLHEHILSTIARQFVRQAREDNDEAMLAQYAPPNYVYKTTEQIELQVALRCLKLPVLEKKFFALSVLNDKINAVKSKLRGMSNSGDQASAAAPRSGNEAQERMGIGIGNSLRFGQSPLFSGKHLTEELLADWLVEHQVFELIFNEALHVEVLRKSYFILDFLFDAGRIGEEQIGLMWETAQEKHETFRVAILKAMTHLAGRGDAGLLRMIFERLKGSNLGLDKSQVLLHKTLLRSAALALSGQRVRNAGARVTRQERMKRRATHSEERSKPVSS
jgi:hypothetical protein